MLLMGGGMGGILGIILTCRLYLRLWDGRDLTFSTQANILVFLFKWDTSVIEQPTYFLGRMIVGVWPPPSERIDRALILTVKKSYKCLILVGINLHPYTFKQYLHLKGRSTSFWQARSLKEVGGCTCCSGQALGRHWQWLAAAVAAQQAPPSQSMVVFWFCSLS